jgi:hypothetical protein
MSDDSFHAGIRQALGLEPEAGAADVLAALGRVRDAGFVLHSREALEDEMEASFQEGARAVAFNVELFTAALTRVPWPAISHTVARKTDSRLLDHQEPTE